MHYFYRHPASRIFTASGPIIASPRAQAYTAFADIPHSPLEECLHNILAALQAQVGFCIVPQGTVKPQNLSAFSKGVFQCCSSGSTEKVKRIERSVDSWKKSFALHQNLWGLGTADCYGIVGNPVHSIALFGLLEALHIGADVCLLSTLRPNQQARKIAACAVSVLYTTPAQARLLMQYASQPLESVRHILVGGAELDPASQNALTALCPHASLHLFYGASETSFVTLSDHNTPQGSVGKAYPSVSLAVRRADQSLCAPLEEGTIWVKSPYLFKRYAAGSSAETGWDANGFLTIGERGWIDSEGYLWLTGRSSRVFTVLDQNIFPQPLERALQTAFSLKECAIVPRKDSRRGHIPVLFYQSYREEVLSSTAVTAVCKPFGAHAVPQKHHLLQAWPLLAAGKTDYAALIRLAQGD